MRPGRIQQATVVDACWGIRVCPQPFGLLHRQRGVLGLKFKAMRRQLRVSKGESVSVMLQNLNAASGRWLSVVATVTMCASSFQRNPLSDDGAAGQLTRCLPNIGRCGRARKMENPFRFLSTSTQPKIARICMKGVKSRNEKINI